MQQCLQNCLPPWYAMLRWEGKGCDAQGCTVRCELLSFDQHANNEVCGASAGCNKKIKATMHTAADCSEPHCAHARTMCAAKM